MHAATCLQDGADSTERRAHHLACPQTAAYVSLFNEGQRSRECAASCVIISSIFTCVCVCVCMCVRARLHAAPPSASS